MAKDWGFIRIVVWQSYLRSQPQPKHIEDAQLAMYNAIGSYSWFLFSWGRDDSVVNGDVLNMLPVEWSRNKII